MSTALLIADNPALAHKIQTVFEFIEHQLSHAGDADATLAALRGDGDYVVTLLAVADEARRAELVALVNRHRPSLPVYLLGEEDTDATPPRGVSGYLELPVQYRRLLGILRQSAQQGQRGPRAHKGPSLTGHSPQLKEIQALVRHVALTDANVLLLGESGTGKEVVARTVHHLSLRNDHPFVAVNCGAIPPELLESELFGHEKGAFTGAISTRKGRFELAEGGTLFLDEIGDMPLPMQVKLLRVLQERCFERVGGTKTIQSNVRLIAATHQDLEKKIGEGKFRLDLYYRLNVFPIQLPALRERPGDIPLLIREFATRMELEHKSPIVFEESAIRALASHPLPGNVRELENLVERLAILYPGETITNGKLPERYQLKHNADTDGDGDGGSDADESGDNAAVLFAGAAMVDVATGIDLKQYLTDLERNLIESALRNSDWVVAKAAKSLSLQRTTLVEKIKKLEIHSPSA